MRTANCGRRAIQKSHIILYHLYYHHDEVIAVGRCGLDMCITISKYDFNYSVIWLLTTQHKKAPNSLFLTVQLVVLHVYICPHVIPLFIWFKLATYR